MAPTTSSLQERLAQALPDGHPFRLYHISTPPTKCNPIFQPGPGARPQRTYEESHFLTVTIASTSPDIDGELCVFALEVIVFTTKQLTTVFVSKADSTGYAADLKLGPGHPSILRTIGTTFLSYLIERRQRKDKRLVLSLFARAQSQYLFPGSVENPSKHVADDRQLIKWWCRVVDPILREYGRQGVDVTDTAESGPDEERTTAQAYLIVPGEDGIEQFLPPNVRLNPDLRKKWTAGHPLREIAPTPNAPPRCMIPSFPDDPKSRYVDELNEELRDTPGLQPGQSPTKRGTGVWRSIKTLEQFWEAMAFRQECSSGRMVGFLWIVFTPSGLTEDDQPDSQEAGRDPSPTPHRLPNIMQEAPTLSAKGAESSPRKRRDGKRRKKLTGPIIPRIPRIKSNPSNLSNMTQPEESPYYYWPNDSRGQIVLTEKDYKRAIEILLRQDFANHAVAATSTSHWLNEVAVLGGVGSWGLDLLGKRAPTAAGAGAGESSDDIATNLIPIKRSAKRAAVEVAPADGATNVLSAGLVRKKPKVQSTAR